MSDFKVHTLGCGSARPSLRHQPSSTVVNHRGNLFMIDCGEGAQAAYMKHHLSFSRLRHIFLTHLHGDHVFGLPGLIGTLALNNTGGHITIHTFEDGARQLKSIFDYFCRDTPFNIEFNIIRPEDTVILETKSLTVRTVKLKHRVPAVGFVFEEKPGERHINPAMTQRYEVPKSWMRRLKGGEDYVPEDGTVIPNAVLTTDRTPPRSYAHISDTVYLPNLAEKIKGVTLLFHETTYLDQHQSMAAPRGHSTARQAAMVARDAGVGTLLTGHYSSRYPDETQFEKEAKEIFPNVILNREGLITEIRSGEH